MDKFDDILLTDYMQGFWGYGASDADYWFVGMEEGGGNYFNEINQRITQWHSRGRNPLEDIYEYHMDINVPKWFMKNAPIQSTWNHLIRVLLSAKGIVPETEIVREYQIDHFGRSNGEVCLLELLPLPSPTTKHWLYSEHSDLPILIDREIYTQQVGATRAHMITKLILKQQPKFVMFYGVGYFDWWLKIVERDFTTKVLVNKKAYFSQLQNTKIVLTQHPVAIGVPLEYFHLIGKLLSNEPAPPTLNKI